MNYLHNPSFFYIYLFFAFVFLLYTAYKHVKETWKHENAIYLRKQMEKVPTLIPNLSYLVLDERDKLLIVWVQLQNEYYVKKMRNSQMAQDVTGISKTISYDRMKNKIQISCDAYEDALIILILIMKILDGECSLQEIKDKKSYQNYMDYKQDHLMYELRKYSF
jgi:hypothetical protein